MGRWDSIKGRFSKIRDRIRGREAPVESEEEKRKGAGAEEGGAEGTGAEEGAGETRKRVACPRCGGRGYILKTTTCKSCNGTGKIRRWVYDPAQRKWIEGPEQDCPNCVNGKVSYTVVCPVCKGSGTVRAAAWGIFEFAGKHFAAAIPLLWKFIGVFVISWAAGYFFGWWPIGIFVFILTFLIMDLPIFVIWGPTLSQIAPWLRFLLMYGSLMGIFWFLVWPLIMGYVGGFFPIIGRSFTQITAAGKKQSDILRSLDFQAYVHQQEAMWEFEEAPTQTSPTAGLTVKKFDVVPKTGCFDMTTYQVITQIQNNAPYDMYNVTVSYINPLSTKLGGWEETVFNTLVAIVLFNPTFSFTSYFYCEYLKIPDSCKSLKQTKLGPNEIILHACPDITISNPGGGRTSMNCPLTISAEADLHTTSISSTQFINDTYAHVLMMQNMFTQTSVPATSSRGPILLNIDPGPQPILAGPNSSDKMTVVVSFSNKGSGQITALKNLFLFIPKEFGDCKGGVFERADNGIDAIVYLQNYCSLYTLKDASYVSNCNSNSADLSCVAKIIEDDGSFRFLLKNNRDVPITISNMNITLTNAPTNTSCTSSNQINITRQWYGVIDKNATMEFPKDKSSLGIGLCANTTYTFEIKAKYTDNPSQPIDSWSTLSFTISEQPYSPLCQEIRSPDAYFSSFLAELPMLLQNYNIFYIRDAQKLKEFGLYPCTLDANGQGLREMWSTLGVTNRRALLFRADLFYRYSTIQDAYIEAHMCQTV
jgi:ribosomal protein L37E